LALYLTLTLSACGEGTGEVQAARDLLVGAQQIALVFTEHVFIEALVGAGVPQPHRVGGDLIGEQQS
jgi:hypothetical protein